MFDRTTQNIENSQDLTTTEVVKFLTGAGSDRGKLIRFTGSTSYGEHNKRDKSELLIYKNQVIDVIYIADTDQCKIRYLSALGVYGDLTGCIKEFFASDSLDEVERKLND